MTLSLLTPRLLPLYRYFMAAAHPLLDLILQYRLKKGKEDATRLGERMGIPKEGLSRPKGILLWIHAASVGEAQSALILIDRLLEWDKTLNILVTTGTLTSARLMEKRLPAPRAFHQFIPLDSKPWVLRFLNFWKPDLAIWMESELWPSLLLSMRDMGVPAFLVNARLSEKSYRRWRYIHKDAKILLGCFDKILAQGKTDAARFNALGAKTVIAMQNIKYSAQPLMIDQSLLAALKKIVGSRPCWVYASTHADEESIAMRVHRKLKTDHPSLLTIIVPRHPERRAEILDIAKQSGLNFCFRGGDGKIPRADDDLYIADTMGELGSFYALCPLAMIGRSLSRDGGGGHNPIEAAQHGCAVLSGDKVHHQKELFDDFISVGGAKIIKDEDELTQTLDGYFKTPALCHTAQMAAGTLIAARAGVIEDIIAHIKPALLQKINSSGEKP